MINIISPIPLEDFGFAKGYFLFKDGRILSERTRRKGGSFKKLDKTGCTQLLSSDGKYVRRSAKLLVFNAYTKPFLLSHGFSPALKGDVIVSTDGVVYSSISGARLSESTINGGYKSVKVGDKSYLVHRIVADAFVPNPNNLSEIDHINGDKSDNSVCNLRWVTRSENMKYAFEAGALSESLSKAREAMKKLRSGYK